MRTWPKRILVTSLSAAILIGGTLLMGSAADGMTKSVHLAAPKTGNPLAAAQVTNLQRFLGTASLAGSSVDLTVKFKQVDAKKKMGQNITGTGNLQIGGKQYPVRFGGDASLEKTASGQDFYVGGAQGSVVVNGKDVPVSLVVTGIPAADKYVVTMTLQPEGQPAIALPFGELFPEYRAHFQSNKGGN